MEETWELAAVSEDEGEFHREQSRQFLNQLFDLQLRQRKREVDEVKYLLGLGIAALLFITSNLVVPVDKTEITFFQFGPLFLMVASILLAFFSYSYFYKSEQNAFNSSISALKLEGNASSVSSAILSVKSGTANMKNANVLKSYSYSAFVLALFFLVLEKMGIF